MEQTEIKCKIKALQQELKETTDRLANGETTPDVKQKLTDISTQLAEYAKMLSC